MAAFGGPIGGVIAMGIFGVELIGVLIENWPDIANFFKR
jgi:hypothetical protein